jgi:hypothetical protein
MIGVSEHAWNVAQDRLGKQVGGVMLINMVCWHISPMLEG